MFLCAVQCWGSLQQYQGAGSLALLRGGIPALPEVPALPCLPAFVQIAKTLQCIGPNSQMYLFKLQNVLYSTQGASALVQGTRDSPYWMHATYIVNNHHHNHNHNMLHLLSTTTIHLEWHMVKRDCVKIVDKASAREDLLLESISCNQCDLKSLLPATLKTHMRVNMGPAAALPMYAAPSDTQLIVCPHLEQNQLQSY